MDVEILKVVGQIAGIGGIGFGVILLVFREVIRKKIFPELTKDQAYKLMRLILVLVWLVALAGVVAWVWVSTHVPNNGKPNASFALLIDKVERVLPLAGYKNTNPYYDPLNSPPGDTLAFDITLRNGGDDPINVTSVQFNFDENLMPAIHASSLQNVSGVYAVIIGPKGSATVGSDGVYSASAWYPFPSALTFYVLASVSQTIQPKRTDKFRVTLIFGTNVSGHPPLKTVKIKVAYNGHFVASSETVEVWH